MNPPPPRKEDDLGMPPHNDAPPMMRQGSPDDDEQEGPTVQSAVGADGAAFSINNPTRNGIAGLGAFPGFNQASTGNLNSSQLTEDQQRRLTLMEQAQTNERNLMFGQNDYGQLGGGISPAARSHLVNQQMLLNHGNPSLQGSNPPMMGSGMNPDMFFGAPMPPAGVGGAAPGFLPQHVAAITNFQSGGLVTPATMHQQHLATMNQMSSFFNGNSLERGSMGGPPSDHTASLHTLNTVRLPSDAAQLDNKDTPSKDMPIRPLSAYNFFFRDERERILSEDEEGKEQEQLSPESTERKKRRLLDQHLQRDRSRRRPHRKTHGKIGFTTLSKLIGKRWRELSDEKKQFYRDVAAMDMARYQDAVSDYNKVRLLQHSGSSR